MELLSSMDILCDSRESRSEAMLGSSEKALARREGHGLLCWACTPEWGAFKGWYGVHVCN